MRGHDVRIISSTHGPQTLERGRHHPPGLRLERAHQRLGRHAHGLAPLRPAGPGDARPRAVRRPPFPRAVRALPVAPAAALLDERQRRHVPRLLRLEPLVRVRQAHAPALRAEAPRPHRGQRGGTPLHRALLPGRLQGHPQRRRPAPLSATRHPSRAGATAPATSCSSAASRTARALMYLLQAYRQLRREGLDCRLLLVGAGPAGRRGRGATSPRASSAAWSCSGA